MTNQSALQSFIQNSSGIHTAGQANVPGAVNNGNPNTVYNQPAYQWSSYLPQVTQQGSQPSVNFQLLTSQAPASSAGYATPFTADPYAAMVLSGLPRAGSNDNVNRILGNLMGGGGAFNPNPGTGTPLGPPVTPPTGMPQPMPTPVAGAPNGPSGTPVGPISGPIYQNPHNWQSNYNNAMPRTNLADAGLGQYGQATWMQAPAFQAAAQLPSTGDPAKDGLQQALGGLLGHLSGGIDKLGNSFKGFIDDISGQNGWQGVLQQVLNGIAPGLGMLIPDAATEGYSPLSPQEEQAMTARMNEQLNSVIGRIVSESGESAANRLTELKQQANSDVQRQLQELYNNAPRMSSAEFNRVLDRAGFINMFRQGNATSTMNAQVQEAWDRINAVATRKNTHEHFVK
jgi:hypothetical protein